MKKLLLGMFIFGSLTFGVQVYAEDASIVVTSPNNGGESLEVGGRIEIRWMSPNITSALNEVYISDGIHKGHTESIRMETNVGSVVYTLDSNLIPGSNYKAYVSTAYGSAISVSDSSDFPFTIKPISTSCSISNFTVNGVSSVTVSNTEGAVLSYITTNCTSVSISPLSSDNGFKLSDTFQIYHPQTRDYILTAFGSDGIFVTKSVHITVGSITTPSISLISPNSGSTFRSGEIINVKWISNLPDYAYIDIVIEKDGKIIKQNSSINDGNETVKIPLDTPAGKYNISFGVQYHQSSGGSGTNQFVPYESAVFNVVSDNNDRGCSNGQIYSSTTGKTCHKILEENAGCYGAKYSIITGKVCPLSMVTDEGCKIGQIFSSTTGKRCSTNTTPEIVIISPNGGEVYTAGQQITVKWTAKGAPVDSVIGIALIDSSTNSNNYIVDSYCTDGSDPCVDIHAGEYTFTIPKNISADKYKIRVYCANRSSEAFCGYSTNLEHEDTSDDSFTINNSSYACPVAPSLAQCPTGTTSKLTYDINKCVVGQVCTSVSSPSLTILSPNGGETYNTGDKITIKWNSENIKGNIVELNLIPKYMQGGEYLTFEKEIPNNGSYTVTLPNASDISLNYITLGNNFKVEVVAFDGNNIIRDSSDNLFTINNAGLINNGCLNGQIYSSTTGKKCSNFNTSINNKIKRTLKKGISGDDVKALQKNLGLNNTDGIYGSWTMAKVKEWQTKNGLNADGIFGPGSQSKMGL